MTYSDFVGAVLEELGPDGTRRGIETQRSRWIRDAMIDLQRFIRAYREGHTTTFQEADLEAIGYAHLGAMPSGAKPKAFYIVSTGDTVEEGTTDNPYIVRNRLDYVAWENRAEQMVANQYGRRDYLYAISPFGKQFLVHPLVNDETYLKIVWDGLKMDFDQIDEVPFPEHAAEAVAAYVKARILRIIDKRVDLSNAELGTYTTLRLALYREAREAQSADGKDEEYSTTMPTIVGFGAQDIPFLGKVTKLSGLDNDYTALSAIPTVNINVTRPYAVSFQNATTDVQEFWQLTSSTAATDGVSVQRPNDYAASTNEKVWLKQT